MIQELILENFLFMQKAVLSFCSGLNVITGETGAGKSVLLEAVKLLLGKKARSGIVLPGHRAARIQASFVIKDNIELKKVLEKLDLFNEDEPDELIISRTFKEDNPGRIMVNGVLTTLSTLKQIGPCLMEIHGQNDHQTLLQPEIQRKYLDRTGDESHISNLSNLANIYRQRQQLQQKYLELENRQRQSDQRIKELQQILQELETLGLNNPEEESILKDDLKRLGHAEQIANMLQSAITALEGEEEISGATPLCYKVYDFLRKVEDYDEQMKDASERALSLFHELQALGSDLCAIADSTDLDPDRLYDVQARLSDISRACRKYHTDFNGLFELQKSTSEELSDLFEPDAGRDRLRKQLDEINRSFETILKKVSEKRKILAKNLSKRVSAEMESLGFNSAVFDAVIESVEPGINGSERIEFFVSLNPGSPAGPLRKIASGGELSRVALAIKKVLACSDELPTLLFDEIDAGIGGVTAEAVASSLKTLADEKQVLLVTHLHQIAKEGHQHFKVSKQVTDERTQVFIEKVTDQNRIEEIARMLGHTDNQGLNFARNLLVKNIKKPDRAKK
jgi:DNA repair protein RecN (Recombination protein N)